MITLIKVQNSFKIVIASLSKTGERRIANDFPRENRWKIRIFFFFKSFNAVKFEYTRDIEQEEGSGR